MNHHIDPALAQAHRQADQAKRRQLAARMAQILARVPPKVLQEGSYQTVRAYKDCARAATRLMVRSNVSLDQMRVALAKLEQYE